MRNFILTQCKLWFCISTILLSVNAIALCQNAATNGSIDATVSGGQSLYSYLWSTGATTQDLSNIATGTYTLTVTDSLNHQANKSFSLIQANVLQAAMQSPTYAGGFLPDFFANPQNEGYTHAEINNHICISEINGQKLMQGQGNEYHPMLNNSRWVSFFYGIHGVIGNYNITVSDTQINSLSYTKIRNKYVYFPGMNMDSSIVEGSMGSYVLLREDVELRRVYLLVNNQEYLQFDFTLEIGDTLPTDINYIIVAIDSILTNAGYRKRFVASNGGSYNIEYVEGVGSLGGHITNVSAANNGSHLLCYYQNDNLVYDYSSAFNVDCGVYTNTSEPSQQINKLLISPNPAFHAFTLETGINDKCKLKIIDIYGKTVVSLFFSAREYQVDISRLTAGIYYVVVTGYNEKLIGKNKLIVQ